jgi:hypothetical protein
VRLAAALLFVFQNRLGSNAVEQHDSISTQVEEARLDLGDWLLHDVEANRAIDDTTLLRVAWPQHLLFFAVAGAAKLLGA